jgi:cyclic pyranopterin phosphate synthase
MGAHGDAGPVAIALEKGALADPMPLPVEHTRPHLRVGLVGECNFRCTYCPPWGENSYEVGKRLSRRELISVLRSLACAGFEVVKFTGGEPTLRRDLIEIVEGAASLFGEVRLITNGWNLDRIAPELAQAGLAAVEVSLDAGLFDELTTSKRTLPKVLAGMRRCLDAGVDVQLNMVVMKRNFDQVEQMLDLIESEGPMQLKLLELVYYEYPGRDFWVDQFVPMSQVLPLILRRSYRASWSTPPGAFGTPMREFWLPNGSSVIVKDGSFGAVYADICKGCPLFPCQDGLYGLSVTADGLLKMCKHRPDLHVRALHHDGDDELSVDAAVQKVVDRYRSSYFLADGWNMNKAVEGSPQRLVEPTRGVLRWYRG